MLTRFLYYIKGIFSNRKYLDIDPDDIFMDSKNLPDFDIYQFEGRIEKSISQGTFAIFYLTCFFIACIFLYRAFDLQIASGSLYGEISENNSLKHDIIFASRGVLKDRNGVSLAYNLSPDSQNEFSKRAYISEEGFGHLLGFIKYPAKDSSGFFYRDKVEPGDGLELQLESEIGGSNGLKISEIDVSGNIISQSLIDKPIDGKEEITSIDSRIQAKMYKEIQDLANKVGFKGGSGIIMNVKSGEILTMTSFPEYSPAVMTEGDPKETISGYFSNKNVPFLDRPISGLYTPGSIIKPFMAFAALEENIISPSKEIVSLGKLVIPNPYFPDKPSIFLDWKAHGAVDMRKAIAVSSDVYFYEIGGGYADQKGLGIIKIKKYLEKFGLSKETGIDFGEEALGNIPDPDWKQEVFGEAWNLGNTYHTSIGQYGMQVTPIQIVRAIAAVANEGTLVTPTLKKQATTTVAVGEKISFNSKGLETLDHFKIVKEGMRMSVTGGTSAGLNVPYVKIGGKTGTAELGVKKDFVNSWTAGFFPYDNPEYAYVIVMESGPVKNLTGATYVMRQVTDFMNINTPEYFK